MHRYVPGFWNRELESLSSTQFLGVKNRNPHKQRNIAIKLHGGVAPMLKTWQLKPVGSTENTLKEAAACTKVAFKCYIIVPTSMVTTNCSVSTPCFHVE